MVVKPSGNLSFCQVDGHLIFFDLENDRYFSLPEHLEHAFTELLEAGAAAGDDATMAILRIVPLRSLRHMHDASASPISSPTFSARERRCPAAPLNSTLLIEVLITVISTRIALKTISLKQIVDGLVAYRERRMVAARTETRTPDTQRMLDAADAFAAARPYLPVKPSCLLDSLSLTRFLSHRRLYANLAFGVTRDPFSAHCWVQAGPWVLNDTLGNVAAHTLIRVI